jgi:hypothetical protein
LSIAPRPPPPEPLDRPRDDKKRPRPRLRAVSDEGAPIAEWASFFGDLARPAHSTADVASPVEWRVHDRTHVEFAIDYPIGEATTKTTWEAYFFIPQSFRLDAASYDKKAIYDDLWSYVRYAVPELGFATLASTEPGSPLGAVRSALAAAAGRPDGSPEALAASRALRLFACHVRASGLRAMRDAERAAPRDRAVAAAFLAACVAVASGLRAVLAEVGAGALADHMHTAALWTDEDVSLVLETFAATLGIEVARHEPASGEAGDTPAQLAAFAVREARHRRDRGLASVGSADASDRTIEHLEFRRHVLKRFTASVLWLSLEVHGAAEWVLHLLYAVAAAVAMAFALVASLGTTGTTASFARYALPIVVAYAVKDRMKAVLQSVFARFIARHFPDRRWVVHDERRAHVGRVAERAGFVDARDLPRDVVRAREVTREHALEERARPETVLWHHKTVLVSPSPRGADAAAFPMLTEIFRLNLHRWLAHTDDPNRKIVFADPDDARVYSAKARRVYNVNIVYRLRAGDGSAPWRRLRVIVSRKGIERIEPVA